MSKPFDYLNSINGDKKDLLLENPEKDYPAFVVNRSLSYFPETVMHSNQMNMMHQLDNRLQYDYYLKSIKRKKRFSKWAKKEEYENLELIMEHFGYNTERAKEALQILSPEHIQEIKDSKFEGGRK